jgi:hypothetical protein
MRVTTDFECGGGKRLTPLDDGRWRVEASGDASGYNKYFCVRVEAAPDEPSGELRLEIHPDADLGESGAAFFRSHFPSNLWHCGESWDQWVSLRNTWEGSLSFPGTHIDVRVPIEPGQVLHVATNPVRRYSDHLAWIERMRARHGERLGVGSLGKSAEGRDIPLLRLGTPGRPRFLVLAGQHPSEHCGNWACEGIVEWLLSSIREAREVAAAFDFAVIPMTNPDGNVSGLSGTNAEGVNLCSAWEGVSEGGEPRGTENRLLWRWLTTEFPPDASLHFHGYMGWRRFGQHPYDGCYVLTEADTLFSPARLAAYRAIQERLAFETPALSAAWRANPLGARNLEHPLAARFGTLSAFYEINSASVAAVEQWRRGPQVLAAVARALLNDVPGVLGER